MATKTEPTAKLIRAKAVMKWTGCTKLDLRKWVANGVLRRKTFPRQYGWYYADEVRAKILDEQL